MKGRLIVKHILKSINHFLAESSGWLLMVIMTLLIIDFMGRAFSKPIQGLSELSIFVLVAAVYFGMSNCEESYGHIRVKILVSKLPKKVGKFLNIFAYALAIITIFICIWAIGLDAIDSFISKEKVAGTLPMVIYPAKFTVVIGTFFYLIQLVSNFIDQFKIN